MKKLFFVLLILNTTVTQAQEQCNCQTQLLRMDIDGNAINNYLNTSPGLGKLALPQIEKFVKSDAFRTNIVKDYPMTPMGFPFNAIACEKEKSQGDPKFKNIDCKNALLCSDPAVSDEVKSELCVSLPCSMILGSQQMDKCPSKSVARPSMVHFSEPIGLKALEMTPTSITSKDNTLRACFTVEKLEITAGVDLEFAKDPVVQYEKLGIGNLKIDLDSKREICMSTKIDVTSDKPVSEIKFEQMNGNFISDGMLNKALSGSELHGLSGYSPATLSILKMTALPPIARYFRPTLEEAVQKSLATTFETKISDYVKEFSSKKSPSTIATPTNSVLSEMGVGNLVVKKYVDLLECSVLKYQQKQIPSEHACLSTVYPGKKNPMKLKEIPTPQEAHAKLRDSMNKNENVTSEALKGRLLELDKDMNGSLRPIIDRIANAQLKSTLLNGVQIMTNVGSGNSLTGIGVALPDICDVLNPSTHAGRSIPNCPIQTYVDIEELNKLLGVMYKTGRLCNKGSGDYIPELNSKGEQVRNSDGSPRGSGCLMAVEEDEDGFRCFLNGAPKLNFDSKTGGYKINLSMKECFRGPVMLGQGKVAGDINFEIGYTPTICGQGDFCLENGQAEWSVVPGTARYALKESSFFNGIVRRTVDKKLNEVIGQTVKLPLSSGEGPMSKIPLEAEGRIDKGPGFFGACLKPKSNAQ